MSKDDFIEHLINGIGSDYYGPGRLRQSNQLQWLALYKAEIRRLSVLSYSELESLYLDAEGLYEMAE